AVRGRRRALPAHLRAGDEGPRGGLAASPAAICAPVRRGRRGRPGRDPASGGRRLGSAARAIGGGMNVDALPPREMARKAEDVGVAKAGMAAADTFVLAILAGAFIAMGAMFATTVMAGGTSMPYGVVRLLGGLSFSLGLILVVVAGAELFTGNNLIVMAWASRKVSTARMLRNWTIVYAGNLVGSLATATAKTGLGFVQAIALAMFCNALVCLAVWLTFSARTTADKILAIVPPI